MSTTVICTATASQTETIVGNSLISVITENSNDVERATDICERAGVKNVTTSGEFAMSGHDRS